MPNNNETTTSFKVDISELKKAMQDAKRAVAVANSEFKEASSACDDWTKSSVGLSAKLKQLSSNLKSQNTILSSLEAQYEAVVAEQGEGSKAADDLKIKINNQKAVINQTERELVKYQDSLNEITEAAESATKTSSGLSDALDNMTDDAKAVGDGFTTLKGAVATFAGNALTSLVGGLRDAASNLLGLAESTREYRDQMSKLESASNEAGYSTDFAKEKYKELYGVLADETAANTTISNFMAMETSEENLNKLLNASIGIWAKYGDSIPLDGLAESVNETARVGQVTGGLADALNWAGISEDDFNKKLERLTSEEERQNLIAGALNHAYGDLSKSYQESNASVIEANKAQADYTDTLAEMGEKVEPVTTSLKQGFNGLLQELLKLVGDVDMAAFTSKIDEGFKVLKDDVLPAVKDGFQWILDNKDSLIAGLAGIAAGFTAFKVAGAISAITTALQGMSVATALAAAKQWLLNTALLANPIILIVSLVIGLVAAVVTFIATNEDARKKIGEVWDSVKEKIAGFVESVKKFFTETLPQIFQSLIDWVKTNWQSILLFLINPFWGLFKYFYDNNGKFKEFVDNAIKFIKELPVKVWTWLLNTINKVNTWRKNMIDKAKAAALGFINKVIEFVKQLPAKVWTWLVNVISKVTTWASNMASKGKEAAQNFVNKVIEFVKQLPEKVWSYLKNVVSKVADWGKNLASKGKDAAKKLLDAVVNKVKEIPDKIKSVGGDVVAGLWNGISNKAEWLKNKIKGFVGNVTDWVKKFFEIGSPSKLMEKEVGKWLPEGIAVGIDKNAKSVMQSMQNLTANTLGAASAGLSSAGVATGASGVVNNFTQNNYSPKALNRLEIYRQSKNLLGYAGGGL